MDKRRLWLVGLFVGLSGVGLWQQPALAQAWQTNRMALAAMEVCVGQQDLAAVAEAPAFLQAGAARCLGDDELAHARYMETLGQNFRADILRAAQPLDVGLARQSTIEYPDQPSVYFWLAEAIQAHLQPWKLTPEQLDTSISAYENGLALDPTNGEEWDNLGRLYEATGEWDKAVQAFDAACHYEDMGRNGCLEAGRIYFQHELYEQALARYQDSYKQRPDYPTALWGLVHALFALDRENEAIPYLQILAAQGDVEAQMQLAQLQKHP